MADVKEVISNLDDNLCHVVISKARYDFHDDSVEIHFMDGPLKGEVVKARLQLWDD